MKSMEGRDTARTSMHAAHLHSCGLRAAAPPKGKGLRAATTLPDDAHGLGPAAAPLDTRRLCIEWAALLLPWWW